MILSPSAYSPSPDATEARAPKPNGDQPTPQRPTPRFCLESTLGDHGPQVRINFATTSTRGIWIECRRRFGDWEFVTITLERPYLDERPLLHSAQIEVREYRVRYFDRAAPHSPWSLVQKIAVEP